MKITISVDAELGAWLEELAVEASLPIEDLTVALLNEERSRRALEALTAWVREEDDGPTTQEIEIVRDRMLGEEREP